MTFLSYAVQGTCRLGLLDLSKITGVLQKMPLPDSPGRSQGVASGLLDRSEWSGLSNLCQHSFVRSSSMLDQGLTSNRAGTPQAWFSSLK